MVGEIELFENETIVRGLRFPHKIEHVTQIVITSGRFSSLVDLQYYSLEAPAMAIGLNVAIITALKFLLIFRLQRYGGKSSQIIQIILCFGQIFRKLSIF